MEEWRGGGGELWLIKDPIPPKNIAWGGDRYGGRNPPLSWNATRGVAICDPLTLILMILAATPLYKRPSFFCFLGLWENRESSLFLTAAVVCLKPGDVKLLIKIVGDPHHR